MKYVILELIPTSTNPEYGDIIQLSAIKVHDFCVVDRFDYRLKEEKIPLKDFVDLISYDKDAFTYKENTSDILKDFKKWVNDYKVLILDNDYTIKYLENLNINCEFICKYLNITYTSDLIEKLIEKYNLAPTNYIVDILLESIIYESNNKK